MHRVALALGKTVEQLGDELSYAELLDWVDYYRLEPFGERRQDLRNALLCTLIANQNRDLRKQKAATLADFMLTSEDMQEAVAKDEVVDLPPAKTKAQKGARISSQALTGLFLLSALSKKAKAKG
jgi:hypothetical protein